MVHSTALGDALLGEGIRGLAQAGATFVIWNTYLNRSKRVALTYARAQKVFFPGELSSYLED